MNAAILKSLLSKEWIKLRYLGWIPFVLVIASLVDYYFRLSAMIAMHGAAPTWVGMVDKEQIYFEQLYWVFVLAGIFWAIIQTVPECHQGRARLALHLPCDPRIVLAVPAGASVSLLVLLYAVAHFGLNAVHATIGFPVELSSILVTSLKPWLLAGFVAWCTTAACAAETSRPRAIAIVAFGYAYISMLKVMNGYDSYADSFWLYALAVLPWLWVPYSAAFRVRATTKSLIWSRFAVVIVGIVALSWFLPQTWVQSTRGNYLRMNGKWSPLSNEFVIQHVKSKGLDHYLESGNKIDFREAHALLPFLYRNDMMKWGKFPVLIDGKYYNFRTASRSQSTRVYPMDIKAGLPPLTVLFENRPVSTSLSFPDDVLVYEKNGIRFVNTVTGEVVKGKTDDFNLALRFANVQFPIVAAGNNVSSLKAFDEGIFFIDSKQSLYQLRMQDGNPNVRLVTAELPEGIRYVSVDENENREFYGLLASDTAVYLNNYDGTIERFPIAGLDMTRDSVSVWSTPVNFSLTVDTRPESGGPADLRLIAADKDMKLIADKTFAYPDFKKDERRFQEMGTSFISPYSLFQRDPLYRGILFGVRTPAYWSAAIAGGLFAALLFFIAHRRLTKRGTNSLAGRNPWTPSMVAGLLVSAIFGLPGFIAALCAWPFGSMGTTSRQRN